MHGCSSLLCISRNHLFIRTRFLRVEGLREHLRTSCTRAAWENRVSDGTSQCGVKQCAILHSECSECKIFWMQNQNYLGILNAKSTSVCWCQNWGGSTTVHTTWMQNTLCLSMLWRRKVVHHLFSLRVTANHELLSSTRFLCLCCRRCCRTTLSWSPHSQLNPVSSSMSSQQTGQNGFKHCVHGDPFVSRARLSQLSIKGKV
jgi:hypothetical protein